MPPEPGGEGREDWYGAIPLGTKQNWGLGVVKRGGWRKDDLFHFLNLKDLFFFVWDKKICSHFSSIFHKGKSDGFSSVGFAGSIELRALQCQCEIH